MSEKIRVCWGFIALALNSLCAPLEGTYYWGGAGTWRRETDTTGQMVVSGRSSGRGANHHGWLPVLFSWVSVRRWSDQPWNINVIVNGTSYELRIISGKDVCVMSQEYYKNLHRPPKPAPKSAILKSYGEEPERMGTVAGSFNWR